METTEVFDRVASKYDLMNDIMSAGTHRYWKECLLDWLSPKEGMKIIDVAGGTGDIAKRFLKRVNGNGSVVVCDPNKNMIKFGQNKYDTLKNKIEWVNSPAENLPFENNTFDAYIVSFGARNFTDMNKSISEAFIHASSNSRCKRA